MMISNSCNHRIMKHNDQCYSDIGFTLNLTTFYKRLATSKNDGCKCINKFKTKSLSHAYTKQINIRTMSMKFSFLFFVAIFFYKVSFTSSSSLGQFNRWESNSDSSWDSESSDTDSPPEEETSAALGSGYETCLTGAYLKGYTLEKGNRAGRYTNLGHVQTFEECVEYCCDDDTCFIALMLTSQKTRRKTCFKVDCYGPSPDSCKSKVQKHSRYHPYLFRRGILPQRPVKVAASDKQSEFTGNPLLDKDLPELIREKRKRLDGSTHKNITHHSLYPTKLDQYLPSLIREKRKRIDSHGNKTFESNEMLDKDLPELIREKRGKAVCHQYTGSVCSNSLDSSKLYFYTGNNETVLDDRLKKPMKQISDRLDGKCKYMALKAICYRFYPPCDNPEKPKARKICSNECNQLVFGECESDFRDANMLKYLQHIIPNCGSTIDKEYDEDEPCVSITSDTSSNSVLTTTLHPITIPPTEVHPTASHLKLQSTISILDDGTNKIHTTIEPKLTKDNDSQTSQNETILSADVANKTNSSNLNATLSPLTTMFLAMNKSRQQNMGTIVDLPKDSSDKGTDLEELDAASSTLKPATLKDSKEDEIRVSAGDNTEITLPTNEVSLYASTWPKEEKEGEYSYKWTQINAPENGHGYIEGATTKNVKLTKLDIPGVYSFQLDVNSVDNRHGVGFINITVKQKERLNRPPRAEVYPKDQTITLPTNTVLLDGSKSSDDLGIVSYKWEELKGPIKHGSVFASTTDSKILQLKNLIAGTYLFKMTVTDGAGETDSTEATVTVKEEQDYPPEANAGSDIIVHLPNNTAQLNGDKSTDDKGIASYEWSKTPESPTCDMQGTDKPHLKLSSLTVGTYVFNLKVTDSAGHSSNAKVKVIVLPEVNTKPIAIAGDDKELVYPDDSTMLDGSKSQDNSKIVSFLWEQVSGPSRAKIVGANQAKAYLSELKAGHYVMKLSVTDEKGLVGTDTVKIHVKKDHNEKPSANAGSDQVIYLPTRDCVIDGSKSSDDEYIEKYEWVRAGSSPAAGDVLNGSDHQKILRLANLIKGKYIFDLTVTDNKGLTGKDTVTINVKEDPNHMGLVELYLKVDIGSFTEENKKQLARKISVLIGVAKEFVHIQHVEGVGYGKTVKIVFYVNDPAVTRVMDGKYISDILKNKIGQGGKLFDYEMERTDAYICRSNCSGHGYCDPSTKMCVCDTFWMGNLFKANFGEKESNCDWSVLYLSVSLFGVFLFFIGVAWATCFCFARSRRSKRRARYKALRNADPDAISDEILLIPKRIKEKFSANSLTFTETDEDSEDDNTVFDKKRMVNGKSRMNGSANGKVKYRDHAM